MNKRFIIFLITIHFFKQLSCIQPNPIVSYKGEQGYRPDKPLYTLSWDPTNTILIGGQEKYERLDFAENALKIQGWQVGYDACVAYNPQGTYGAAGFSSGAYSGHIKIYDFVNNSQALDYPGQLSQYFYLSYKINFLAWSPDGTKLAAIYDNTTLKLYNISITPKSGSTYARATLNEIGTGTTIPNSGTVTSISWNQGSTAIVVTAGNLYIYDTQLNLKSTIQGNFTAAAWNPISSLGSYLATCDSSGMIYVYKLNDTLTSQTNESYKIDFITNSYGIPTKIAWSYDGTFLAVCSKQMPHVKTFKFSTSTGILNYGTPVKLQVNGTDIGFKRDNKYLAVTAGNYLIIYSFDSTLAVTAPAPVAGFSAAISGLTANFTDSSTNTPTSWSWNFGDNTTSTEKNPSHTYSAAGNYNVKLIASNSAGSSTEVTKSVTVTDPALSAARTALNSAAATNYTSPSDLSAQIAKIAPQFSSLTSNTDKTALTSVYNNIKIAYQNLSTQTVANLATYLDNLITLSGTIKAEANKTMFEGQGAITGYASAVTTNAEAAKNITTLLGATMSTPDQIKTALVNTTNLNAVKAWRAIKSAIPQQ